MTSSKETDPTIQIGSERTCWPEIDQAVQAVVPFADVNAAKAAGFEKLYSIELFNPVLPSPSSTASRILDATSEAIPYKPESTKQPDYLLKSGDVGFRFPI